MYVNFSSVRLVPFYNMNVLIWSSNEAYVNGYWTFKVVIIWDRTGLTDSLIKNTAVVLKGNISSVIIYKATYNCNI